MAFFNLNMKEFYRIFDLVEYSDFCVWFNALKNLWLRATKSLGLISNLLNYPYSSTENTRFSGMFRTHRMTQSRFFSSLRDVTADVEWLLNTTVFDLCNIFSCETRWKLGKLPLMLYSPFSFVGTGQLLAYARDVRNDSKTGRIRDISLSFSLFFFALQRSRPPGADRNNAPYVRARLPPTNALSSDIHSVSCLPSVQ